MDLTEYRAKVNRICDDAEEALNDENTDRQVTLEYVLTELRRLNGPSQTDEECSGANDGTCPKHPEVKLP